MTGLFVTGLFVTGLFVKECEAHLHARSETRSLAVYITKGSQEEREQNYMIKISEEIQPFKIKICIKLEKC